MGFGSLRYRRCWSQNDTSPKRTTKQKRATIKTNQILTDNFTKLLISFLIRKIVTPDPGMPNACSGLKRSAKLECQKSNSTRKSTLQAKTTHINSSFYEIAPLYKQSPPNDSSAVHVFSLRRSVFASVCGPSSFCLWHQGDSNASIKGSFTWLEECESMCPGFMWNHFACVPNP